MRNVTKLILVLAFGLLGCAAQHEPSPVTPVILPVGDCLRADGHLSTILSIDNNDRTAHGGIVSSAIADSGRLVVGSSDGALKTWTLEGDFLGLPATGAAIATYGPESTPGSTPAMDMAFDTDAHTVWTVDPSGYLSGWDTNDFDAAPRAFLASGPDGAPLSSPGDAVAVGGGLVFAAFMTADANNVAWMPTSTTTEETTVATLRFSYMDAVRDVVFAGNAFIAVGRAFDSAAINRFEVTSEPGVGLLTGFSITMPGSEATSIAVSPDGRWLAIGGTAFIAVVPAADPALGSMIHLPLEHSISSVAFSRDGAHVITIDALSTLRAFDARTLEPGLVQAIPAARRIARHPTSEALVVTRSDGHVDVMSCGTL